MRNDVFEGVDGGRGTEFGNQVHDFAEAYALSEELTPSNDDERHIATFLDSLDGELLVEEDASFPLDIDGRQVTVSGIVDLIHVTTDSVEIVD